MKNAGEKSRDARINTSAFVLKIAVLIEYRSLYCCSMNKKERKRLMNKIRKENPCIIVRKQKMETGDEVSEG